MKKITSFIFTDGSSRGNPGKGGWGSIIVRSDGQGGTVVNEIGGKEEMTTNNRMEINAAVQSLTRLKTLCGNNLQAVTVYTDSSYLINGITKWIAGWKNNGWKTKAKDDVLNKDLWHVLDIACRELHIKWEYVGGHVGIKGNERCDEIATGFADGKSIDLYDGPLEKYEIPDILNIDHDLIKVKAKDSRSTRSKAIAYSYVSVVDGKIEIHKTWAECEKRVKGVKGARYKKALNHAEESALISQFGGNK